MLANRRPSRGWVIPFANITLKILKRWWWWWWPGWLPPLIWVIEGSRKGITLPRNVRTLEKEKSWDLSLRREAGKSSSFFFLVFFSTFVTSFERTTMGRKWEREINGHLFNKLPRSGQDTWCHVLCLTVTSRIVCRGGIRLSPNWGALISARDSVSSERQMLRFFSFSFSTVSSLPPSNRVGYNNETFFGLIFALITKR